MAQPGPAWPSRADGLVALAESFLAGHEVGGNGGESSPVAAAALERYRQRRVTRRVP
jgi:hypothetical protein